VNEEEIKAMQEENARLKAHSDKLLGELKAAKKGSSVDYAEFEIVKSQYSDLQDKFDKINKSSKVEIDKLSNSLKEKESVLSKHLIDGGLSAALAKNGVAPQLMDGAMALLRQSAAIGDGYAVKLGDKALDEAVKDWVVGDVGKFYVSGRGNSGGGATGSSANGGKNTMSRDNFDSLAASEKMNFIRSGGKVE
jgi:hypothetical protein